MINTIRMKEKNRFIEKNRARWEHLDTLVKKRKRTYQQINEMFKFYQLTIEDLSFAQTHFPNNDVTLYLNQLIRKCHLLFYQPRKGRLREIGLFFQKILPATMAQITLPILLSLGIFLCAILFSFLLVVENTEMAEMFLSAQTYEMVKNDLEAKEKFGNFDNIPKEERVSLSFFLWFNNSRVAVLCFVLGITLGIGTVYILLVNGFMLGTLLAFYFMNGHFIDFLSIIMVHGSIELLAIIIAGGIGFNVAGAIFNPNRIPRKERLKRSGRIAMRCIVGVIALLLIAGLIEGLVTPMKLPIFFRFIIAAINTSLLLFYFISGFYIKKKDKNLQLFV